MFHLSRPSWLRRVLTLLKRMRSDPVLLSAGILIIIIGSLLWLRVGKDGATSGWIAICQGECRIILGNPLHLLYRQTNIHLAHFLTFTFRMWAISTSTLSEGYLRPNSTSEIKAGEQPSFFARSRRDISSSSLRRRTNGPMPSKNVSL